MAVPPTFSNPNKEARVKRPIKLPLPPGQCLVFDYIAGDVYIGRYPTWAK